MSTGRSSIITDVATGRVEAEITGIDTTFTLTELATGKVVLNGRTFSRVSSDYPGQQQRFARVRAPRRRGPRRQGDRREHPHAPRVVLRRRHLSFTWSR